LLFEDTLAFGGLKMIRRILGLAHVEDLESIADPARRAICERKALRLGRALVVGGAKFSGVADLIEAALQTANS
jgi:5-methylthioribose kinase